ncbi:MAG: Uma2 family endonuclease [Solirubrobacterales bacterium]
MSEAIAYTTFDEFLAGERTSERRHEFVGGRIYAMSGGTERHDLMAVLISDALAAGTKAKGCRRFVHNRLVNTRIGNAYYPDVMVACGSAPDEQYETDPTLIVEIQSPSTRGIDRREKATAYAMASTLRLLLLVDPNERRIEVAHPADGKIRDWAVFGPGDVVFTDYGVIHVDALCDELDATATI